MASDTITARIFDRKTLYMVDTKKKYTRIFDNFDDASEYKDTLVINSYGKITPCIRMLRIGNKTILAAFRGKWRKI